MTTGNSLETHWSRLARAARVVDPLVAWALRLTPPLPAEWPRRTSTLLVYAYAEGIDMSGALLDGVRVAAPWAVPRKNEPGPEPHAQLLAPALRPIGVQGVRSLRPGELASGPPAPVETLRADGDPGRLRRFYNDWRTHHGVSAQAIQRWHPEFSEWLTTE